MHKKITIVGGGTVGKAIEKLAEARKIEVVVLKDISPNEYNFLPADTTDVVVTAQAKNTEHNHRDDELHFVNTELPRRTILECAERGIRNIALFSTGSVYGQDYCEPVREEDIIHSTALHPYALSKLAMEAQAFGWKDAFASLKIYRPFMMYGPGLPELRLLGRLPGMITNGQEITLASGKGLICNPIHVNDVANFVLEQLSVTGCDIFNLCGNEIVSLHEIAEILGELLNKAPKYKLLDEPELNVVGCSQKSKRSGLKHTILLKKGLNDLLKVQERDSEKFSKRTVHIALPSTGLDEWHAVKESILSGWLTQGPKVSGFERAFAERHQVNHALAVTSCTTGLHLSLETLGVGPGDEVIVPAFSWVATANAVLYCGATPIFCDVDRSTFNIDVNQALSLTGDKTKAIIPVHLFGLCADIDKLREGLPQNIYIIEDAACAAGASYKGRPAGTLGDMAAFSFHPRKSITTGEGGMVTTNTKDLADRGNMLRNHGASISEEQRHHGPRPYLLPEFNLLGYNYRMTDLQGAVGQVQLSKLDEFIEERAKWAAWYNEALSEIDWLICPREPEGGGHAWQAYVTVVDPSKSPIPRNDIMDFLQKNGVATRPGTHAIHMLNYYKKNFSLSPDDFPNARYCDANTMAIPLHNRMKKEDYEYVVNMLKLVR